MNQETLVEALDLLPQSRWRDAALAALKLDEFRFEGQPDSTVYATAGELLETYRVRLEHVSKRGIQAVGIEELLEVLELKGAEARLRGTPFLSRTAAIHAFWEAGKLIGCVTVKREAPDSGQKSFNVAMGRST